MKDRWTTTGEKLKAACIEAGQAMEQLSVTFKKLQNVGLKKQRSKYHK